VEPAQQRRALGGRERIGIGADRGLQRAPVGDCAADLRERAFERRRARGASRVARSISI
jgi:hypothetical protein